MEVQLEPPVGTNYFKSYKCRLSGRPDGINSAELEVTFYIYVTRVKPTDPDFASKGGRIYIVAVYQGVAETSSNEFYFGFSQGSVPMSVHRLPPPGAETVDGDRRTYTIDYSQTMSMFNNGGNNSYNFPARYKRVYSLTGYRQTEEIHRWVLVRDGSAGSHDNRVSVGGLHIFEPERFGNPTFILFFKFSLHGAATRENFVVDFTAQTMEDAQRR